MCHKTILIQNLKYSVKSLLPAELVDTILYVFQQPFFPLVFGSLKPNINIISKYTDGNFRAKIWACDIKQFNSVLTIAKIFPTRTSRPPWHITGRGKWVNATWIPCFRLLRLAFFTSRVTSCNSREGSTCKRVDLKSCDYSLFDSKS